MRKDASSEPDVQLAAEPDVLASYTVASGAGRSDICACRRPQHTLSLVDQRTVQLAAQGVVLRPML